MIENKITMQKCKTEHELED